MVTIQTHDDNQALGANRQRMLSMATGDYVNFVDDDDLVTEDYAAMIYPHLGNVDAVAFSMKIVKPTREVEVFQPLMLDEVSRDFGYCRDILHLSPLRREIATAFPMEGGRQEDVRWARKIREAGLIRRQMQIARPLYEYYPGASRPVRTIEPPAKRTKIFHWQEVEGDL